VLSKRRCPHTGVVNIYSEADPYLALGSVVEVAGAGGFLWRCYANGGAIAGRADNMRTAEHQLTALIRQSRAVPGPGKSENRAA
jgi:hypothetical protein